MIEKQPISFARKRPGYRGRKRATPCFANGWCASYSATKGGENPKGPAPARREGRVACFATLRLLCCYSAAQGGRRANAPLERDGRVAVLATLKLLCGGGLEGAPAAPLLLRRGGQSYSAPCCLGEASRFTSFSNSAVALRQALDTCEH